MLDAIENRISRRTFDKLSFSKEEINQINSYIETLNKESSLTMEFLEDGSEAFSSFKKSYGLFNNVKSLILMKGDIKDKNLKEKIGYYGEELVLHLTNLSIGTCWVGGTFDKNKLKIENTEELICVIVIGKVKAETIKEKMIRKAMSNKRKSIKERLISDTETIPKWLTEGLKAVTLAPSARNSQKVMFEYKNSIVFAKVPNDYEFDLVDLGIAKKHFELAANGKFEFGNNKQFILN